MVLNKESVALGVSTSGVSSPVLPRVSQGKSSWAGLCRCLLITHLGPGSADGHWLSGVPERLANRMLAMPPAWLHSGALCPLPSEERLLVACGGWCGALAVQASCCGEGFGFG